MLRSRPLLLESAAAPVVGKFQVLLVVVVLLPAVLKSHDQLALKPPEPPPTPGNDIEYMLASNSEGIDVPCLELGICLPHEIVPKSDFFLLLLRPHSASQYEAKGGA